MEVTVTVHIDQVDISNPVDLSPVLAAIRSLAEQVHSLNQDVQILSAKESEMSGSLDDAITSLLADDAALKAQVAAAPAAIATLIATAIAAQVTQGVTPTQLKSLTDLHTALSGDVSQLQTALQGTPPPPPVVTPPVTTTPPVATPPVTPPVSPAPPVQIP